MLQFILDQGNKFLYFFYNLLFHPHKTAISVIDHLNQNNYIHCYYALVILALALITKSYSQTSVNLLYDFFWWALSVLFIYILYYLFGNNERFISSKARNLFVLLALFQFPLIFSGIGNIWNNNHLFELNLFQLCINLYVIYLWHIALTLALEIGNNKSWYIIIFMLISPVLLILIAVFILILSVMSFVSWL